MKMTPELTKAAEKMKPGALSKEGFFGDDQRDLATLIADQYAVCRKLGVSWARIGRKMRRIGREGLKGFGCPVVVDALFEVVANENRGKIPSPFIEPGMFQKTVYTVKNLRSGKTVRFTELSIHMIEKHGFFQGVGAPFYNAPETLVEVLDIERHASEKPDVPLPGI